MPLREWPLPFPDITVGAGMTGCVQTIVQLPFRLGRILLNESEGECRVETVRIGNRTVGGYCLVPSHIEDTARYESLTEEEAQTGMTIEVVVRNRGGKSSTVSLIMIGAVDI